MKTAFVGIDTSNYTTSLAIVTKEAGVVANLKAPLPVRAGECGLRQSDAVFAHTKNLPELLLRAGEILCENDLDVAAVGVSEKPRDVQGSYMPCFLSGVAAAKAFSVGARVPLFSFSHQSGHIMAALYGSGARETLREKTFGAFHVSGGTTDLLLVTPDKDGFFVEEIGKSADLHAGQAIDRVGVALGLTFPCGPALEELAAKNDKPVPRPRVSVKGTTCHLSGLENLALDLFRKTGDAAMTADFVLSFLSETIVKMSENFRAANGALPLLFAGGVMSNKKIAAALGARLADCFFSPPAFSADNAVGTAFLTLEKYH